MDKHTKAPWTMHYDRSPDDKYADAREVKWQGSDNLWVSVVMQGRVDDERGNADAKLISAAPELLEALRDARERMIGNSPAIVALRNKTDAAIAKATK